MNDSLKIRLMERRISVGSWITIGHPAIAEIMARSGFDWLTVDMEHSAITFHEAQQLIQVIDLCGVVPLVRVGQNEPYYIKRVMDAGAHGVIVPMVNSREDAIRAVNAVKYPPVGTRGVGLSRAQGYGMGFSEYREWVNEGSIVIVQIEHIDAVNNLEKILAVEGVDGFMVGPYDLSASMGRPGDFDHPDVTGALVRVLEVSGSLNALSGIHVIPPDAREVNRKIDEGYRFIAFCLDTLFLGRTCLDQMEGIRRKHGG